MYRLIRLGAGARKTADRSFPQQANHFVVFDLRKVPVVATHGVKILGGMEADDLICQRADALQGVHRSHRNRTHQMPGVVQVLISTQN